MYLIQPDINHVFTDLSKNLNLEFKDGGMKQSYWGPYVEQVFKYEIRSRKRIN